MTNDPAVRSTEPLSAKVSRAEIDIGLRQFMLSVYNYVASGLALTGIVAYVAAESGLYAWLVKMPLLFWAIVLAPVALVFFLSFRIEKMSVGAARATFWAYAALARVPDVAKDRVSSKARMRTPLTTLFRIR